MTLPQGVWWRGKAWISPGLGIFLGHAGNHDWHSHMAHQITVSLNGSLTVKSPSSSLTARAICIRAGVSHRIEADEVLSIYLDALSDEARALPGNVGVGITPIEIGDTAALRKLLSSADPSVHQIRQMVRHVLNLATPPASDPRLQSVLAALKEPINGRQALAMRVHLSPSRFSHWFVEQTGLPLRSYRKWNRLVMALQHIAGGANLTAAAHAAGFADAAHFSRTFRELFGLDPSSALGHVSLKG
ncbi:MAG: AraC family transcriptional regulator [Pseudomonadales bacterium RIFCSPLOWO2_02_FULL_63_210]|nr:MAG: AraC family transcriptional regulator [Pseudomonadales bacterium RIFCSPLOWO2_02_FULL_63_210]